MDAPRKRAGASRARTLALECLLEVQRRDARADNLIDSIIDRGHLDAADKAFATRLVLGVVSMRGSLDAIIDRCLRKPTDVKEDVRTALRISTYEIVYLGKDAYASVSQGVELVKGIAPRAGGLANSVLRKVSALKATFPFGDPKTNPDAYALLHGFPTWLVKEAIADIGSADAHALVTASNEPAPLYIAINAAKARDAEVVAIFEDAGFPLTAASAGGVAVPGCFELGNRRALADGRIARLLRSGAIIVSDASAQAIAHIVVKQVLATQGARTSASPSFLELCAGRGTKTVLFQSGFLRASGSQIDDYVTLDNIAFKRKLLVERARDLGIHVADCLVGDATRLDRACPDKLFDCVFIDAPCSGLGTLRRHPEIRWRIAPTDIARFSQIDQRILASAAEHVAPGGILAYSTCTITKAEDADPIVSFLSSEAGSAFELVAIEGCSCFQPMLRPAGPDSHFLALMTRV